MLVRKQILVPAALDEKIRRLAQKRGISQSALIVACGFRSKAITHSGRKRSPIPGFPITPPGGLLATA
jgi:hypothetical protein